MKKLLWVAMAWVVGWSSPLAGETVRLKATADVGLSSQVYGGKDERLASMGLSKRFKLKSVQEMAAIRFDAAPAKGREVLSARLFLRRLPGADMLRHVRVSTVNQDWQEGKMAEDYGPASGACYLWADFETKRPWAWAGSEFADVVMTGGNSLSCYAERKELPDGWISVPIAPELVYALVAGDSDGLAVCDGGNLAFHNNFIHSVQSAPENAPYIEVELGKPLTGAPAQPKFKAEPAPEGAHLKTGAIRLTFQPGGDAFCWQLKLDGKKVDRWRVGHPPVIPGGLRQGGAVSAIAAERASGQESRLGGPTVFFLEDLQPGRTYELEVVAVAASGEASSPVKVRVAASPALDAGITLGELKRPLRGRAGPATAQSGQGRPSTSPGPAAFWAAPPLVKVSPERPAVLSGDTERDQDIRDGNAVWDGSKVDLSGARGEYVSFQVCVENRSDKPLTGLKLLAGDLAGPGDAKIGGADIELYRNWYAQNGRKQWQPAYCVPYRSGTAFDIPDPKRDLPAQQNQTFYVDIYIPKDAAPGDYTGAMALTSDAVNLGLEVSLKVHDFALPDRLAFWPQLNTYSVPKNWHAYFRLAHQHRCVHYYRSLAPDLKGSGKDIQVVWDNYDKLYGPLLDGSAFADCRRAGVPIETAALPFADSWPTPLTPETYAYKGYWPKRGDTVDGLNQHYMTCPPIEGGLSQSYKDAFLAVERQFIEHFRQKGWNSTEMQCVFVGKNTHRTQYGINMWWTTDEPYHWVDWLALRFFDRLFVQGRGGESPKIWSTRADISRPQWQGLVLQGATDTVYYGTGALAGQAQSYRCRRLAAENPLELRAYGSANADTASNHGSLLWILNAWLNGAGAALPWQSLGGDEALDKGDPAGGGNALLVPGDRFGLEVVADMRLKAFRDGEQLVEYLNLLARRRNLSREQLRHMVQQAVAFTSGAATGASPDNADALVFSTLKDWQLAGLRRELARLIMERR